MAELDTIHALRRNRVLGRTCDCLGLRVVRDALQDCSGARADLLSCLPFMSVSCIASCPVCSPISLPFVCRLLFISPFSLFHMPGFLRLPFISFMSPCFIVLHFPLYPSGLFNFSVHVSHLPFLPFILLHLSFMSLHARSLPSVSPSVSLHFPGQIPSCSFIAFPRSCPFFILLYFTLLSCKTLHLQKAVFSAHFSASTCRSDHTRNLCQATLYSAQQQTLHLRPARVSCCLVQLGCPSLPGCRVDSQNREESSAGRPQRMPVFWPPRGDPQKWTKQICKSLKEVHRASSTVSNRLQWPDKSCASSSSELLHTALPPRFLRSKTQQRYSTCS